MKSLLRLRRAACVAAVALLTGCGGWQPPISVSGTMQQVPAIAQRDNGSKPCGWLAPIAKKERRLIYVANGDEVLIFPERPHNPAAVGCIVTPVNISHGIYVDRFGKLYVANGNSTVTAYPRGSLTPSVTYSTRTWGAMYPIVDHNGDVFVSTCCQGVVLKFLHGQPSRYQILQAPASEVDGLALDRAGNLYAAFRVDNYHAGIVKFKPGSNQGINLGISIQQPQGLIVTSDGTILVVQTGRADGVYVFPRGSTTPSLKLTVGDTPVQLALTEPERKLFVSAFGLPGSGRIYAAPYPLTSASHFHVKKAFFRTHNGHRRRKDRFQIQGMAIGNAQTI